MRCLLRCGRRAPGLGIRVSSEAAADFYTVSMVSPVATEKATEASGVQFECPRYFDTNCKFHRQHSVSAYACAISDK